MIHSKIKFAGNTLLVLFIYLMVMIGVGILVDMAFGQTYWVKDEIVDKLGSGSIMSVFLFIGLNGSTWLKRFRSLFLSPEEKSETNSEI